MSNFLKPEKLQRLRWAFSQGWSTRACARYAGCSTNVAFAYARRFQRQDRCPCGESASHRGWCSWRSQNSPARLAAIRRLPHTGRAVGARDKTPRTRISLLGQRRRRTVWGERFQPRRVNRPSPTVWPFILDEPTEDQGILVEINRMVPKYLHEEFRQDVCQDVAVAVLTGAALTRELVRDITAAAQRLYRPHYRAVPLDTPVGRDDGPALEECLSEDHPQRSCRPLLEPPGRSYQGLQPIKPDQFDPPRPIGYPRGEHVSTSKLNADQVVAIRYMYRSGKHSQSTLAKLFRVSQATVFSILVGGTWQHVGGPVYKPKKDIDLWKRLVFDQEGSQDSAGTFSSPTNSHVNEVGCNALTVADETSDRSRGKSPGVFKSDLQDLRTVEMAHTSAKQPNPQQAQNREIAAFLTAFCESYKKHRHATYLVRRPKDISMAKLLLATYGAERLALMVDELQRTKDPWIAGTDRGIGILTVKASWLDSRIGARVKDGTVATAVDWFEECKQMHGGACGLSQMRHHNRKLIDAGKAQAS